MPIKVVTFDLDNTLWDVEPALLRAEEAQRQWLIRHRPGAIDRMGHDELMKLRKRVWKAHPELAHNVSAMRQRFLHELQRAAGFTESAADEGASLAFAAFLQERQKVELYADALAVLETLAQRFRLGALTNGNADVYKTDAGEYFDFAYLAEDIGASKPAPDMFHAALHAAGVNAKEVVHVGDNPEHDVLGALRVGMQAIWLNADATPWSHGDDHHNYAPHGTITTIGELPAAIDVLEQQLSSRG
ncbi:MAG: HAD-IA family hydrolase [Congregibacter sp.]|nr:HAD-IA family hydrolase [Congregibacter sp.]